MPPSRTAISGDRGIARIAHQGPHVHFCAGGLESIKPVIEPNLAQEVNRRALQVRGGDLEPIVLLVTNAVLSHIDSTAMFNPFNALWRCLREKDHVQRQSRKIPGSWKRRDFGLVECAPSDTYTRDNFVEVFLTDGTSRLIPLRTPEDVGGTGG